MVIDIDYGNIWVSSLSLRTNTQILQAAYKSVSNQLTKSRLSIDVKKCEVIYFTRCKCDANDPPSTPKERAQPQYIPHHTANG
jgi:hypothetical protein